MDNQMGIIQDNHSYSYLLAHTTNHLLFFLCVVLGITSNTSPRYILFLVTKQQVCFVNAKPSLTKTKEGSLRTRSTLSMLIPRIQKRIKNQTAAAETPWSSSSSSSSWNKIYYCPLQLDPLCFHTLLTKSRSHLFMI